MRSDSGHSICDRGSRVGEDEAVALDDRSARRCRSDRTVNIGPSYAKVWNSPRSPHGSIVGRQLVEQRGVELAAGERRSRPAGSRR